MIKSVLVVAGALCASDAAWGYCSTPSAPSCATRYGSFDDEDDFARCRRQMISYQSEVESLISCVTRELREAQSKAQSDIETAKNEYSNAVDRFNRRARSD